MPAPLGWADEAIVFAGNPAGRWIDTLGATAYTVGEQSIGYDDL